MTTLHLGVVDAPYEDGGKTTGDVATILEAKYHVMELFYETHRDAVASALTEALKDELDNLFAGKTIGADPYLAGGDDIKLAWSRFIDTAEIEGLGDPGVPTQAAKDGVSHRFKSRRGPRRPSFVDTGLYENAFRAWVTD